MTEAIMSDEEIAAYQAAQLQFCMEAMTELYHRLPWGMEIVLSNGQTVVMKKFVEPKIGKDGQEEFGFDLAIKDSCGGSWICRQILFQRLSLLRCPCVLRHP